MRDTDTGTRRALSSTLDSLRSSSNIPTVTMADTAISCRSGRGRHCGLSKTIPRRKPAKSVSTARTLRARHSLNKAWFSGMPVACAIGATGAPSSSSSRMATSSALASTRSREYPNSCGVQICWSRDRPTNQRNSRLQEICSCSAVSVSSPYSSCTASARSSGASMRSMAGSAAACRRLALAHRHVQMLGTAASGWPAGLKSMRRVLRVQTSCETIQTQGAIAVHRHGMLPGGIHHGRQVFLQLSYAYVRFARHLLSPSRSRGRACLALCYRVCMGRTSFAAQNRHGAGRSAAGP